MSGRKRGQLMSRWLICSLTLLHSLTLSMPTRLAQRAETQGVYAPSAENFPNPERGFYHQAMPLWLGTKRYPQNAADLRAMRDEGISLVRWYFVIDEYRDAPLD